MRRHIFFSCFVPSFAVLLASSTVYAYTGRDKLPSVEVHLEVLNSLRHSPAYQPPAPVFIPPPAASAPSAERMPFAQSSKPLLQTPPEKPDPRVKKAPALPKAKPEKLRTQEVVPTLPESPPLPEAQYEPLPQKTAPQKTPDTKPVPAPDRAFYREQMVKQHKEEAQQTLPEEKLPAAEYQPEKIEPEKAEPALSLDTLPPLPTPAEVEKAPEKQPEPTPLALPKPSEPEPSKPALPEPKLEKPKLEKAEPETSLDSLPPLPTPAEVEKAPEKRSEPAPLALPKPSEPEPSKPALPEPKLEKPKLEKAEPETSLDSLPPLPTPAEVEKAPEKQSEPAPLALPKPSEPEPSKPALPEPKLEKPKPEKAEPETSLESLPPLPAPAEVEKAPEKQPAQDKPKELSPKEVSKEAPTGAPAPIKPTSEKEEGWFTGLKAQITEMLGGKKKEEPESPKVKIEKPANEEEMPMPDLLPETTGYPESASPNEPKVDKGEEALNSLPALPKEDVKEVPVATKATRQLPPLNAITSSPTVKEAEKMPDKIMAEKAVPEKAMPEKMKEPKPKAAEQEPEEMLSLPPLPEETHKEEKHSLPSLAALGSKKPDSAPMPEKPSKQEIKTELVEEKAAKPVEKEVASPPKKPEEAQAVEPKSTAKTTQPEVTFDDAGRRQVRLLFGKSETEVPLVGGDALKTLVEQLKNDPSQKLEVVAYAGDQKEQPSMARRVSLARALAVRAYFMDAGIDTMRIQVKAMGNTGSGKDPKEYVDIKVN